MRDRSREVPPAESTVSAALRHWAALQPHQTALIYLRDGETETSRLTYGRLDVGARGLASRLAAADVAGKPVLIFMPPGPDFVTALFGCFYAGAIAVPLPYRPRPRAAGRLRLIVREAGAAALVTDVPDAVARELVPAALPCFGIASPTSPDGPARPVAWDAPAIIQYTSGSTSAPKGVLLTHANLTGNLEMLRQVMNIHAASRYVTWLPMHHDMGLVATLLAALYCGAQVAMMPPVAFLQQPRRWLQAIARYGATLSGAPNFAYEECVRRVDPQELAGCDLSGWATAYCGAEPIRRATLDRFAATFAPLGFDASAFLPCYGLAEATVFVTGGRFERGTSAVSCGRPVDPGEIVIVDPEAGTRTPAGDIGEIWIAGPHVAAGYWRNAEATARTFGARLDGAVWLRSGDLGWVRGGELVITGRLDDVILFRGMKIHPEDLERSVALCHPALGGIGVAVAVEIDNEDQIVIVHEVAVRHPGPPALDAAVRQIALTIADHFGLALFDIVLVPPGAVPRTTSGKPRRRTCRELYLSGGLTPASASMSSASARRQTGV